MVYSIIWVLDSGTLEFILNITNSSLGEMPEEFLNFASQSPKLIEATSSLFD